MPVDRRARPAHPTVTVVVPARNEANNLRDVLGTLPEFHEIVVVDGHSEDDTAVVVQSVRPDARLLQQTRRGKGNALACGMAAATGDVIVLFDADGSADPGEIDRFVAALGAADMAKGSRALPGGGSTDLTALRRAGNRMLTSAMNLLFRTDHTDLCYGYNALWRDVVPSLDLPPVDLPPQPGPMRGDGFEIEAMLHCRAVAAGLRVVEVPSMELDRRHGTSNLSVLSDGLRVLRTILAEWRLGRTRPERSSVGDLSAQRQRHASGARSRRSHPDGGELLDAAG